MISNNKIKKEKKTKRFFRKAILNTAVVGAIITVITGLLIMVIGFTASKNLKGIDEFETCHLSILANDQLGRFDQGREQQVSFKCSRQEDEVDIEDVELRGRINDEKFKQLIIKKMKRCWDMTGNGQLDPFRTIWANAENYCLVCEDLVFTEDLLAQVEAQDYHLLGFHHYLITKPMDGFDGSFYHYVRNERPETSFATSAQQGSNAPNSEILLSNRYSIVWRVNKFEANGFANWLGVGDYVDFFRGGSVDDRPIDFLYLPKYTYENTELGAAFGAGLITRRNEGDRIFQQVFLIPEERMGLPFKTGDDQREFCTRMIN